MIPFQKINLYELFLQKHPEEIYPKGIHLQKHHIIPRFESGTDSNENFVRLSPKDHTLAHFYRYRIYFQLGYKVAYEMRRNQTNEVNLLREKVAAATNKINKRLFWDVLWQSKQGEKGGKKRGKKIR
jgi:hypothetical protein